MLLRAEHLSCRRGERQLFSDFSLQLSAGEILQIAGPNGSGKTTLLRALAGLFDCDSLSLFWDGEAVESALRYADELVYIGHRPALRTHLTVAENLAWFAVLDGIQLQPSDIETVLQALQLQGYESELAANLSAGQRRRVALARLELSGARLWLLDEPFNALDQAGVDLLRSWIEGFVGGGGAVVLTTHQQVGFASPNYRIARLGDF